MSDLTLDPPGSIVVVGGGPLGIEAALYGRYLGYNVTLIEAEAIGHSLQGNDDAPVPMLPDRCLSPLAISAINAQSPEGPPFALPTTMGEWINNALIPLAETDLLRGRVQCPTKVTSIATIPIEPDEEGEDTTSIPPDFRLTLSSTQAENTPSAETSESIDTEAIILAIGAAKIPTNFELPADYFFELETDSNDTAEHQFLIGLKQIVDIYAQLADRQDLDLYRPQRGTNMES